MGVFRGLLGVQNIAHMCRSYIGTSDWFSRGCIGTCIRARDLRLVFRALTGLETLSPKPETAWFRTQSFGPRAKGLREEFKV